MYIIGTVQSIVLIPKTTESTKTRLYAEFIPLFTVGFFLCLFVKASIYCEINYNVSNIIHYGG